MWRRAGEAALAPAVAADDAAVPESPAAGSPAAQGPPDEPAAGRNPEAEATAENDKRDGEPVERR